MSTLSNKNASIKDLFDHMNFKKDPMGNPLNRIDTYEIIAVIILCLDGTEESLISNVITMFGFENG